MLGVNREKPCSLLWIAYKSVKMARRRAGSWTRERERARSGSWTPELGELERGATATTTTPSSTNTRTSPSKMGEAPRCSTISPAPTLPPIRDESECVNGLNASAGTKAIKQRRSWRRYLCSVKCAAGSLAVLAIYSTLVASWGLSHRLEPCEVAKNAQVQLQKLRLAGRPEAADLFPSDWEPKLPKIIHHQWKTSDIPEKFKEWNQKWFDLFPEPEYTHMMWTDESGRALIKEHYPWFLETYDNYDYSIKRADAVRYFFLYHYGGLHADLDYEPLVNFYNHLPQDRVGLVESPYQYNESTQNSLMTSPKGDPFWLFIFTQLIEKKDKSVLKATGPHMLDRAVKKTNHPIHVLPCENFHRIPFGESGSSPFLTFLHRELLGRLYPMKQCGAYNDEKCHLARHHNTAVYLSDTGVINLLL